MHGATRWRRPDGKGEHRLRATDRPPSGGRLRPDDIDWSIPHRVEYIARATPPASDIRPWRWASAVPWAFVATLAAVMLLTSSVADREVVALRRIPYSVAWPRAVSATLPGSMPDGPLYQPMLFLDARSSVGTAPTARGDQQRLLLRTPDGADRELRRMPYAQSPQFTAFVADADVVVWAEMGSQGTAELWTADLRTQAPARLLTTATGNAIFTGSQYDLVITGGRVYWATEIDGAEPATQIRSVALTGGPVDVRNERGSWSLTAWPWLVDGRNDQLPSTRMRNLHTGAEIQVATSSTELATCSPSWCRILVRSGDDLAGIELMRPDGTGRRRIGGGAASSPVTDVAPLDRFAILAEPAAGTDTTGEQRLLVYDLATGGTVDLGAGVTGAACRGGLLWWSTGTDDHTQWHSVDLRTV